MSFENYSLSVGDFSCTIIEDGGYTGTITEFFPEVNPEEAQTFAREQGYDPAGIKLSSNCMLIDTGHQKIVIDTGVGYSGEGKLLANLDSLDIQPADIDLVIITHAHADHYGGLMDEEGHLVFTNATYVMWQSEWNYWLSDQRLAEIEAESPERAAMLREHLLPIKDRLSLIDESNAEIAPGITAVPAPGHTPGHMAIKIESGDDLLLYVADAVVSPLHMLRLDWVVPFDTNPAQSHVTRVALAEWALANDALVMSYHFVFPGLGRWAKENDRWCWQLHER
jgi:glyoxylase-like metal-dependent hydrolase (beta-lactamase superfamily II)